MCEEEGITQRNKDLWQGGVNGLVHGTGNEKIQDNRNNIHGNSCLEHYQLLL